MSDKPEATRNVAGELAEALAIARGEVAAAATHVVETGRHAAVDRAPKAIE